MDTWRKEKKGKERKEGDQGDNRATPTTTDRMETALCGDNMTTKTKKREHRSG